MYGNSSSTTATGPACSADDAIARKAASHVPSVAPLLTSAATSTSLRSIASVNSASSRAGGWRVPV
jgi:hypothetical protein